MPRVIWTEEAEEQLTAIPSDEAVEELLALAAGLARFPERGRHVPELQARPAYEIVREVILPRKARVFYLFVPDSNEVIILGLLTHGRVFRSRILGRALIQTKRIRGHKRGDSSALAAPGLEQKVCSAGNTAILCLGKLMDVTDRQYFQLWLKALRGRKPEKLWQEFTAQEELPPLGYSNTVSAVYSANIEGNSIDLNSYLQSKFRGRNIKFKATEREEIELLEAAYDFAQTHALNEKNLLLVHGILASGLLPKSALGVYRDQMVYVYSRAGMEYAALEPDYVPRAMRESFSGIRVLKKSDLSIASVFYHAVLIHLVFVHIHPFMDGNGRAARLLEKWFLATQLGREAWQIPSEWYYREQLAAYYKNIKIGLNYHTLDYDRCIPFLMMLVKSILQSSSETP